ncbi:cobalamin binding intrinsic factor-like isoform X2 [Pecten maximus]|uniref:cobalamin binding intrinsic factor-like isoform X2 n=1 Tax=Pecten maximus TaxID=6579 RepID=UPI0014586498|nr:cobalamin binding intrinsic factor-like isoform X2 [Pecten maximus]
MSAASTAIFAIYAIYNGVIKDSIKVSLTTTPKWSRSRLDTGEAVMGLSLADPYLNKGNFSGLYKAKLANMNIDILAALGKDPELTSDIWARGKLAQYISGIMAARQEQTPTSFYGYNLVNILKKQLAKSIEYFRTNRFALSLMAIALCQQNETFGTQYEEILTANPGSYIYGIDEASMITMACVCLNTTNCSIAAEISAKTVSRRLTEDNLNVYSVGLAAQALIATENVTYKTQIENAVKDIRNKTNIPATMNSGLGVSQILPPIANKSFLDIVHLPPLYTTTPSDTGTTSLGIFITVEDLIMTNTTTQYSANVSVTTNPTLLQAMIALQEHPASNFSFETIQTSLGPLVITVNDITRNETNMFWQILLAPDKPLKQGVAATFPDDGDHYIFNLTFFRRP